MHIGSWGGWWHRRGCRGEEPFCIKGETPGGEWGFLGPCPSPGSGGWVREAFAAKIGW